MTEFELDWTARNPTVADGFIWPFAEVVSIVEIESEFPSLPFSGRWQRATHVIGHTIDIKCLIAKSGANAAAFKSVKKDVRVEIRMRQSRYLNNGVERRHRAVKRLTRPMLGFKSFWSARIIAGIETMNMIKKAQMNCPDSQTISAANKFYSLAA